VVAAHGQVDGLLNVAGIIQPFVPFADLPLAVVERVMGVNFWGPVHTMKAFLPLLLERPAAAVVNVSSMGGLAPVPGQAAYGASKAAIALLTEGLYAELRGSHVRVTVVYPGGVATRIAENSGVDAPRGAVDLEQAAARLTTAPDAARQIVDGMVRGRFRVVIGRDARMLDVMSRVSPRRATETVARRMASLLGS
jgi:short-subunit dehydrogenase